MKSKENIGREIMFLRPDGFVPAEGVVVDSEFVKEGMTGDTFYTIRLKGGHTEVVNAMDCWFPKGCG